MAPENQGRVLRCDLCGEPIGQVLIEEVPIDPKMVVSRCYACAATEAAEAITADAVGSTGGETHGTA